MTLARRFHDWLDGNVLVWEAFFVWLHAGSVLYYGFQMAGWATWSHTLFLVFHLLVFEGHARLEGWSP